MASKKDDKREDAKREIDTPPFTGKITLERNEHGVLVAMVEGSLHQIQVLIFGMPLFHIIF